MEDKKEITITPGLTVKQTQLIYQKTDPKYVKTRPGPKGMTLSYVEVGYIIKCLNDIFGFFWNFEITNQEVGNHQVVVRGKLTIPVSPNYSIVKENYGGAEIKKYEESKLPIDIANDMKAAASDCLKKCASMLGIAQDLYWKGANEEK